MINFRLHYRKDRGYILPATLMLSLAIAVFSVSLLQTTATSSDTLNTQSYQAIADDAARSGITYADSCLQQGPTVATWTNANQLKPNTACNGTTISGSSYVTQQGSEWRSYFSVAPADANNNVVSTGYVEILNNNIKVKTYKTTVKMPVSSSYTNYPISSGESITALKAQNTDCAIANGKMYCWGRNGNGEVGNNTTTDSLTPSLVGGNGSSGSPIYGKTVTDINVSDVSVCAIADGTPYCWGQNVQGQLGSGNHSTYKQPTANVPLMSGDLGPSGGFVTEISTSPFNLPTFIWPLSLAFQHTCALKADGSVACWGSNGYRQLTKKDSFCLGLPLGSSCVGFEYFYYPDSASPELVDGYSNTSGPFAGKKAERVAASSHDSCMYSEGRTYCWGVEVPLNPTCGVPGSPLFFPSNVVGNTNLNPCTAAYSAGYDMSSKVGLDSAWGGFQINTKKIDPASWQLSANLLCGMANADFFCAGVGPTVGFQFLPSFNPPWQELPGSDITSHDNGDNEISATIDGIYCAIDRGAAKCMTSLLSGIYGGSNNLPFTWGTVVNTAYKDKIPTKIAAGTMHVCLVANGQLYCWGASINGRLANGSTTNAPLYPALTGTTGSMPIGTIEGTYAADGPVSTDDGHTCATVNGQLFCWGSNTSGQLGTGDNADQARPLQVAGDFIDKYVTKVSTGKNHTCGIMYGKLYCWGSNTSGQLGLDTPANIASVNVPTLVNGKGELPATARVTDVSAGDDNTCAIANGQLYCWGSNTNNKLGLSSGSSYNTPKLINSNSTDLTTSVAVTKVSVGPNHTCAVGNANAYCWGSNADGRTGLGTSTGIQATPKKLTGGSAGTPLATPNNLTPRVSDISAGGNFSCGIFNSKTSCWGNNDNGQLGTGPESWVETGTPYKDYGCVYIPIINPNGCIAESCGFLCTKYYKWVTPTINHTNELRAKDTPAQIQGPAGNYYATSVSAGTAHTCALIHGNQSALNGNIWCWGNNANGQLGDGTTTSRTTPTLVTGGATVDSSASTTERRRRVATSISAGASNTCSVANAVVICWGSRANGRLGDNGTSGNSTTPSVTNSFRKVRPYGRGPVF